jgi:hypothetical protein
MLFRDLFWRNARLGIQSFENRMHFKRSSVQRIIAPAVAAALLGAIGYGNAEPLNGWVTATGTPTLTEAGAGQLHATWGGAGITVFAPIGSDEKGYTLEPGDRLTFSGFVTNTSFNWGNQQFRFGLFSNNGEPADVFTNWLGYWIPNTTGGSHSDGPHKRIAGQTNGFWQTGGSVLVGSPIAATGGATANNLPYGVYAFSIMLARLDSTNLNISWELQTIADRTLNPVSGVYSFAGTTTDASIDDWTFNRAMLFTGNTSGTVSCSELAVTFSDKNAPIPALVTATLPANPPAPAQSPTPKVTPQNVWPKAAQSEPGSALWVMLTGLGGIMGLLIWGIVIVKRLARNAMLAQESKALTTRMIGDDSNAPSDAWRQRALAAEALAAKQTQILDEKVGPELKQFAKEALVQGLYHQRNALIETQKRAQQALADLENRLSELNLPVHERIRAYEKRIAELEKELESRDEEMRELTRATLLLVKQKLEKERESTEQRYRWE